MLVRPPNRITSPTEPTPASPDHERAQSDRQKRTSSTLTERARTKAVIWAGWCGRIGEVILSGGLRKSRGDTLIEVLFATSIFSLVAVGGLSIMNQGAAASERALEITLVRNEIDAQAETLRFLNTSYIAAYQSGVSSYPEDTPAGQWQLMQKSIKDTGAVPTAFGATGSLCQIPPKGSFVLNTRKAIFNSPSNTKFQLARTFSQVVYNAAGGVSSSDGIWIEAIRSATIKTNNQSNAGYIDFNIRACWDSAGQSVPATIGTIVRLYEPR